MRPDMGRVIIERPRHGSSAKSRKARTFGKIVMTEDGPEYFGETKLPMSMNGRAYGWDSKSFTDVLGPFQNFLRSSVGRHWDDVFSDISKILGSAGWGVRHILTEHLDVEQNCFVVGGKVCFWARYGVLDYPHDGDLYVDPVTGVLCLAGDKKKWRTYGRRIEDKRPIESMYVTLSESTEYRWLKGVWYFQQFDKKSARVFRGFNKLTCAPDYDWVETVTLIKKKQLNKKELRDFRAARHKITVVRKEHAPEELQKLYGKAKLVRL